MSKQDYSAPLKVVRPFPLKKGVLVQILNVGPGVMAEDNYDIHFSVGPGAHVVVDYEIQEAPEGARVRLTYSYYFARWVSLLRLVWWWERAKPFLDEPDP